MLSVFVVDFFLCGGNFFLSLVLVEFVCRWSCFFGQLKTRINLCWGSFHIIRSVGHDNKNHTPPSGQPNMIAKWECRGRRKNETNWISVEWFSIAKKCTHSYKNDRPLITFGALLSPTPTFLLMYVFLFLLPIFFVSFVLLSAWRQFFPLFFLLLFLDLLRWSPANGVTIAPVLVIVHSFINIVFTFANHWWSLFLVVTSCSLFSLCTARCSWWLFSSSLSLYFRNKAHFSPPMDFNSLWMNLRVIIRMHTIHCTLSFVFVMVLLRSVAIYIDSGR